MLSLVSQVCQVSFQDAQGMRHSVEVSASSLYEAAVLGLKVFRESDLVEGSLPGPATTLTITVRRDSEAHEAKVSHIEAWLSGQGKTPREQALKVRLRERVGTTGDSIQDQP